MFESAEISHSFHACCSMTDAIALDNGKRESLTLEGDREERGRYKGDLLDLTCRCVIAEPDGSAMSYEPYSLCLPDCNCRCCQRLCRCSNTVNTQRGK